MNKFATIKPAPAEEEDPSLYYQNYNARDSPGRQSVRSIYSARNVAGQSSKNISDDIENDEIVLVSMPDGSTQVSDDVTFSQVWIKTEKGGRGYGKVIATLSKSLDEAVELFWNIKNRSNLLKGFEVSVDEPISEFERVVKTKEVLENQDGLTDSNIIFFSVMRLIHVDGDNTVIVTEPKKDAI
mmetsp:Transcript_22252/g.46227  ORF Transcript_22252/g.46227 Transcript_22252/m.46227 type:complete len:184 (+) Transcript_22252:147-698(+)